MTFWLVCSTVNDFKERLQRIPALLPLYFFTYEANFSRRGFTNSCIWSDKNPYVSVEARFKKKKHFLSTLLGPLSFFKD